MVHFTACLGLCADLNAVSRDTKLAMTKFRGEDNSTNKYLVSSLSSEIQVSPSMVILKLSIYLKDCMLFHVLSKFHHLLGSRKILSKHNRVKQKYIIIKFNTSQLSLFLKTWCVRLCLNNEFQRSTVPRINAENIPAVFLIN